MKIQYSLAVAGIAGVASGHTIFCQLETGGTTYPVSYGVRTPTYDGFIGDVTSNDLACNGISNGGGAAPLTTPYVLNVTAGSTVEAVWRHTLQSGSNDVIDPSHKGPLIAYLKKVANAQTDPGYGSGWFKIQEDGYDPSTKLWGVDRLIASGGIQNITIPNCIANGQYLLRGEIIALHGASNIGGAQFYMECAQINVSGGTGSASPATVSIPGAYKATDPGIHFNLYQPFTNYTIPGKCAFSRESVWCWGKCSPVPRTGCVHLLKQCGSGECYPEIGCERSDERVPHIGTIGEGLTGWRFDHSGRQIKNAGYLPFAVSEDPRLSYCR